ncbi:NERD domain-containing protein [Burkholderia ubonensis]|uniref:NERD domain-containing protein n=1 Tax=Burkholderia ubonensis TaxID=101571 RepID=UPI000A6300F5|nr:NERD domain-containing protein [Burkholderia ubonensis]
MPAAKFSVETLKGALETYDWQEAKRVLDVAGGPAANPDDIAEALRRTGSLVLEYPVAAEKRRDALLKSLELYLSAGQANSQVPTQVAQSLSTIRVAEAGYRKLVGVLSQTDASKLEPTIHVSAAIQRAEDELAQISAEFQKQASQRDGLTLQTQLLDESGNPVDMGGVLETFVGFVSMTLQMEAFRNKWFGSDGIVVVPSLPDVTKEAIYQVGSTMALAIMWRRWRATEERARVLGRTLRFLNSDERPKDAPKELIHFIVEEGDHSSDWLHRVALERVTDKMSQNLIEISASLNINRRQHKQAGDVRALPPHDWISDEEVHGLWALEQYLAYDILADQERPGGLRLVEWVRGYCALMLLAREAKTGNLVRTHSEWQNYLARFGLPAAQSDALISRLTFSRSSRDLFDHPFIKVGGDRYRLFALALHSLSVPVVVLSTLSHLSVQLKRKGKSFEEAVREIFEKAGIKPYAFRAKRGDEEYEYDAVIPWGDYLFVIECKNRALPFGSPIQMRYFDLQTQDNIRQVHRLMKGLEEHPDILETNLPPGAATKTKVSVVVNCFPYSTPGRLDNVYLYDYSALSRFFESGEIKMKAAVPGKKIEEYSTRIRLWKAERPSPDDLIAQMDEPAQFTAVMASLKRDRRGFPLAPDTWVFDVSLIRHEPPNLREAAANALATRSREQQ